MCLHVDAKKTEAFKQVGKRKIPLQKVLNFSLDTGLTTWIMDSPVEAGWLKAENPIDRIKIKSGRPNKTTIDGGAIHAYSSKEDLKGISNEVVKCWAYAEDFIACDSNSELTFKKIWIPIEEVERIERKHRRRNKK